MRVRSVPFPPRAASRQAALQRPDELGLGERLHGGLAADDRVHGPDQVALEARHGRLGGLPDEGLQLRGPSPRRWSWGPASRPCPCPARSARTMVPRLHDRSLRRASLVAISKCFSLILETLSKSSSSSMYSWPAVSAARCCSMSASTYSGIAYVAAYQISMMSAPENSSIDSAKRLGQKDGGRGRRGQAPGRLLARARVGARPRSVCVRVIHEFACAVCGRGEGPDVQLRRLDRAAGRSLAWS